MSKLADVQAKLFEDSFRSACGMVKEFEDVSDQIVAQSAKQIAQQFRGMPLRVRQEVLVLMEQYNDKPDQMLLHLEAYLERLDRAYTSPFARLKRWLSGGGDELSQSDWAILAVVLVFLAVVPVGVYLAGQTVQVFQDSQVQTR